MPDSSEQPEQIQYTLLENGLDFIASGLRYVAEARGPSELKYAVLNLGSGIELVLKERLRREDWKLIFPKPESATEEKYQSGDFRSVDIHTGLERLEYEAAVDLPPDSQTKIKSFYDRRNRFQHFRFVDTREAIESAAVDVLAVVLDFIGAELELESLSQEELQLLADIRGRLGAFDRFRTERIAAIKPQLRKLEQEHCGIMLCPSCLQTALSADCEVECLFCGFRDSAENAADLYISNVIYYRSDDDDGRGYPRFWCPDCGNKAMTVDDNDHLICFACGCSANSGELKICPSCGDPKDNDSFVGDRCSDCFDAYVKEEHT